VRVCVYINIFVCACPNMVKRDGKVNAFVVKCDYVVSVVVIIEGNIFPNIYVCACSQTDKLDTI
jgi:hypothetical protein